jgi:hypothetical protein
MLNYNEDRYMNKKIFTYKSCISIDSICPDSSGTIAKQREVKNGLTIVAYIEKYINKIQHILNLVDNLGYNFIPTKSLHCTLSGLSSPSSLWNKYYENLLIEM